MRADDAELQVIGALVRDNGLLEEVASLVDERDFLTQFGRRAFAACRDAVGPFDESLLLLKIGNTNANWMTRAVASATNPPAAIAHARRIRNTAQIRRLIDVCTAACAEAASFDSDNPHDVVDLVTRHQTAMMDVSTTAQRGGGLVSTADSLKLVMRELEHRTEERKQRGAGYIPGHSTGYPTLDMGLGGLQRQHMVVIGAQTGVGKSAMALNMASNAAARGAKVAIMSHEMGVDDISMRRLAASSKVFATRMQLGDLDAPAFDRLERAVERIRPEHLWVTENPPRTIPRVVQECLQHKRKHGLDIVFVDYLQLMEGTRHSATREQIVAEIARGLKQMAMQLDVCVVAMSQLNYNVERNEEPGLSSLRESAAIGQNSNSVILLWEQSDNAETLYFKIAKNRSGPMSNGKFRFLRSIQLIEEIPS